MYCCVPNFVIFTLGLIKCRLSPNCLIGSLGNKNSITKKNKIFTNMDIIPFKGEEDRFEGIQVDSTIENCKTEEFLTKLEKSLQEWENGKKRGVWFKIALEHASWVPILAKKGFDFHHARNGFVVMYKWLPQDENCNIPSYAHTMVGVGAVVINELSEILVVREKYWKVPHWKLPGGYVEPGENIVDAAIREVYEETKIRTEFCSLLTMRHAHKAMFECSDMYFVVSLKPHNTDLHICDRELVAAEWMGIEDYLKHPNIHELNKFFVQCYLDYSKNGTRIDCKHGIHQVFKKPYTVYKIAYNESKEFGKLVLQDK